MKNTIPEWDLSDLYAGISDMKVAEDKRRVLELVSEFTKRYKGKINASFQAEDMLLALKLYEKILNILYAYNSYASYVHAKDSLISSNGIFFQEAQEFATNIQTQLLWFDLSLIALDDKTFKALQTSSILEPYRHYLERQRAFKPYTLSEKEEAILSQKSQTSHDAYERLYDELTASQRYELDVDGEIKQLSYSEMAPFLTTCMDRNLRQKAAEAVTRGLEKDGKLYTFILNALLLDKKTTDEIRGYIYPQQATLLSYEIDTKTVQSMTSAIEKRYAISERFYEAKKKLLHLKSLHEWDRYSPVSNEKTQEYSWEEAKKIVLDVFGEFSPEFRDIALQFFEGKWIDAKMMPGKRDGAFCSYSTPDKHPYIFLNFAGQMRDVETLAHELGHGIHAYLSQTQTLLACWPSTVTSEIASIFCETITFEALYKRQTDKKIKLQMLGDKIQSSFATIFRQNAFYLFESDIHQWRRQKGELSLDDFTMLFQKRMQPMFGKGLTLTNGHKYWWMPILHFYHYNFYVFSYAFGHMMSTALYARYKDVGKEFVDSYTKALSMGSSEDPYIITKTMGVDMNASDFWTRGLNVVEGYVDEFVKLSQ